MSLEIPTAPFRVKVYQLEDDDWADKGTGYCIGELRDSVPHILVRNEQNHSEILLDSRVGGDIQYQKQQQTLIVWTEPTEPKTDIALSFQESEGCSAVCDFLIYVQATLESNISLIAVLTADDDTEVHELIAGPMQIPSDPQLGSLPEVVEALSVGASNQFGRDAVVKSLLETDYISKLKPLFAMAEDLESINDLHELCRIMKILFLMNDTTLFETLLKDENIMAVVGMLEYDPEFPTLKANHRDYLADETRFNEVVPIPLDAIRNKIKETFRLQFLKDVVLARLLDDSTYSMLTSMIYFNQMEIIGFLQNTPAFTSMLFAMYKSDSEATEERKRDGIKFVHQMAGIAKNFQAGQRTALFNSLIRHGLFLLIHYALKCENISTRILGTELMVTIIDHDANLVRSYESEVSKTPGTSGDISSTKNYNKGENKTSSDVSRYKNSNDDSNDENDSNNSDSKNEINKNDSNSNTNDDDKNDKDNDNDDKENGQTHLNNSYTNKFEYGVTTANVLIELLSGDEDIGLKAQASEALKVLLDPGASHNNGPTPVSAAVGNSRMLDPNPKKLMDSDMDLFLDQFYMHNASILFKDLLALVDDSNSPKNLARLSGRSLYEQLCEIMAFCIRNHGEKSRDFFTKIGIWKAICRLIRCGAKQVRLAGVRLLKQGLAMDDSIYMENLIEHGLIEAVLANLLEIGNRNNLVHSSCLDVLAMIDRGVDRRHAPPGSNDSYQHSAAPSITSGFSSSGASRGENQQHVSSAKNSSGKNMRLILNHIVEEHGDKLRKLEYTGVAKTLLERHLQSPTSMYAEQMTSIQTDADHLTGNSIMASQGGAGDDDNDIDIDGPAISNTDNVLDRVYDVERVTSTDDDLFLSDSDSDSGEIDHEKKSFTATNNSKNNSNSGTSSSEKWYEFDEDERDLPFVPVGSTTSLNHWRSYEDGVLKGNNGLKRGQLSDANAHENRRGPRRRRTSENFTDELIEMNNGGPTHGNDTDEDSDEGPEVELKTTEVVTPIEENKDENHATSVTKAKKNTSSGKTSSFKRTLTTAGKKLSMKFKSGSSSTSSSSNTGEGGESGG